MFGPRLAHVTSEHAIDNDFWGLELPTVEGSEAVCGCSPCLCYGRGRWTPFLPLCNLTSACSVLLVGSRRCRVRPRVAYRVATHLVRGGSSLT